MPAEGFLQQFHDLAEPEEEIRCKAALKVRQVLTASEVNAATAEKHKEDLQYALRRLVRGVQSSRQCCRQGFSLALAELLAAFPGEVSGVLQLINQHMELQTGLKPSEQKERLLGRLFAYAGILEAGCLRETHAEAKSLKASGKKLTKGVAGELGRGLHEIYAARGYLRAPASRMLAEVCRDLCAAGLLSKVPEALEAWTLDERLKDKSGALDVNAAALALELRVLHEESAKAAGDTGALQAWPACVRQNVFAQPAEIVRLVKGIGGEMGASLIGDAVPYPLGAFCHWWFRSTGKHDPSELQASVWPALDETLFPEHASTPAQAQGLRALGELASRLRSARSQGLLTRGHLEALLSSFFESMPRGLALLLRTLSWPKAQTHPAAVFAHQRLVNALGVPPPPGGRGKKDKKAGKEPVDAPTPLKDCTRLAILAALQRHKGFGAMPGNYHRQWQHSLLAPLRSEGVRARCASLIADLQQVAAPPDVGGPVAGSNPAHLRMIAAQLEQLTEHSRAPDEVILAVLCFLFTAAYFAPASWDGPIAAFSLRAFRSAVGIEAAAQGEDLQVLVLPTLGEEGEEADKSRGPWRAKLWAALSVLTRRPLPEMVEKISSKTDGGPPQGGKEEEDDEAAAKTPDMMVRTTAYHGCLSDGTLVIARLHEWWDYLAKVAPQPVKRSAPKKKPRREEGETLRCLAASAEEDAALRKRCVEVCRSLTPATEADGALPARQRRALCGLPLSMSLALLGLDDAEERAAMREQLEEIIAELEKLPKTLPPADVPKKRAKAERQRAEILSAVPRMAAELFVEASGLVREAAKTAWRELGEFTQDETLTSLCASIRDADDDDEKSDDDEEGSDDDAEGGEESAAAKAKAEKFAKATEALKAQRAKEEKQKKEENDDEKDEDEGEDNGDDLVLDSDAMMQQLLEDGDGQEGGLLAAFASSGLDGSQAAGQKLSKRQQRLRQRQEEIQRKFREIDLLENFLGKFVDKRPIGLKMLRELHESLWAISRRALGSPATVAQDGDEAGGEKKDKKKSKADAAIRHLESDLAARVAKLLVKMLKQICRPAAVAELYTWHSTDEWAEYARALCAFGTSSKAVTAGPRPVDVGALLLYFFCAAHRAALLGGQPAEGAEATGWDLAEETLGGTLRDWGQKKECERWCETVLGAFSQRNPSVLLKLPWLQQIRGCGDRRAFARRAQVAFVATRLLQGLPPQLQASALSLATGFAELCSELLESTLVEGGENAASQSQRQKLRKEALRGIRNYLKMRGKLAAEAATAKGEALDGRIGKVVAQVRDALPARRGEVYQLCLYILRSQKPSRKDGKRSQHSAASSDVETPAGKRKSRDGEQSDKEHRGAGASPARTGAEEAAKGTKQRRLSGQERKAMKGGREFFSEM